MSGNTRRVRSAGVSRREFLQWAAVGATTVAASPRILAADETDAVKIEEPFDGAILHHRHGTLGAMPHACVSMPNLRCAPGGHGTHAAGLKIAVSGTAPAAAAVTVNGVKAGGLIGRPLRLDITRHVKPGENEVLIEPLSPKTARLLFYQ